MCSGELREDCREDDRYEPDSLRTLLPLHYAARSAAVTLVNAPADQASTRDAQEGGRRGMRGFTKGVKG